MKSKTVKPSPEKDLDSEDLPDGWLSSTFGDIADVVAGGTPTASDETNFSDDGYPWITPADLSNFSSVYIQRGRRSLSEKGLQISAAKMLPKGTVLMSSRAPIGYVAIAANPISTNQGFKNFICHEEVAPEYVYYWIKYLNPFLEGMGSGSTFAEISGTRAKKIPIRYPPLSEQQRIVARVEDLLMRVNATRDRLIRVPLIMKKFWQGVLAAACSGRLTEGWREENPPIESSDQLIDRVIKELQKKSLKSKKNAVVQLTKWDAPELLELLEIPENWTWIAIKDATSLMQYGISIKSDSDEKSGIPILRMGNIQEGSIDLTDLKFIPANTESISNFIVETGDILFNRTNSPELVGKSAVYNEKLRAVFASYLVRVRPNSNLILSDYLCWWINSMWGREWARNVRTDGVSQSNINAQKLSVMPVPLPPLAEQHEIGRRVNALFERADAFDQEVAAASRRCERLTQAVLGKAFAGRL